VLENSGRHLALIELGSALKLVLTFHDCLPVRTTVGNRIGPPPRCRRSRSAPPLTSASSPSVAFYWRLFETSIAKMRVFRVPEYLGAALMLGLLATLLRFVSESF